jgi:uncharacterized repeat protein (TIGR01451 family)
MRAVQRTGARLTILSFVLIGGGVAAWWGLYRRPAAASNTKGPSKQVATGVNKAGGASQRVQPAAASLTDGQSPGSAGLGAHALMAYGGGAAASPMTSASASLPPPTSPYLPAASDPTGGNSSGDAAASNNPAGGGQYIQYGAAASAPALPSADPLQPPAASVPSNPYRTDADAGTAAAVPGYASLSQSPYAAASQTAPAALGTTGTSLQPVPAPGPETASPADAAGAYASRFNGGAPVPVYGALANGAATPQQLSEPPSAAPLAPAPLASAPLNALSASDLSSAPYAAPAASARSLAGAASAAGKLAAPTPGERQLEGPQQPAITLEKVSPAEIQVGKPAVFELYVRNAGQVAAQNVVITDHVPTGTQLQAARPQPQQGSDGSLVWSLGTMQPGEETQITLEVIPQSEGEIGSTAQVTFAASASSRSICTRPQLTIEHTAPPKVLIGDSLTVAITISNPGSGPATGVTIEEDVPDGLVHAAGAQLEYEVGTLRPGESKRLELSLKAQKAGVIQNTIHARGEANLAAQHAIQIEVVAPQLQIGVEGPKVKFLERQATYTLQVANPGTAPARDVEVVAALPKGMRFVNADAQGQYDQAQHAVFWSLAELPAAKAGAVKLTTLPIEPGEQRMQVKAQAEMGLVASGEQVVQVKQDAELSLAIKDLDEVIEVGSETTYEIRVTNSGTKAATNVRIAALLPAGMAALGGEGPTRAAGDPAQVAFEPLARLNPQEEVIYKVQVQGKQPGDHLVRVQLSSDEWPTPVTREESTRVYQDR